MRKAKSGPCVDNKKFFFANGDMSLPRVEVTVDGYLFRFTCNRNLAPTIVLDTHAHSSIKAKAYEVAAVLFKKHIVAHEDGYAVRQPGLF